MKKQHTSRKAEEAKAPGQGLPRVTKALIPIDPNHPALLKKKADAEAIVAKMKRPK